MNDLISREDVKAAIKQKYPNTADQAEIIEVLNAMPAVDAIPQKWLHDKALAANDPFCPFMLVMYEWFKEQQQAATPSAK